MNIMRRNRKQNSEFCMRAMITFKNISLSNGTTRPIIYDLFIPDRPDPELIIFCHGFKGFKNWGPWDLMGDHICRSGYAFVKFNFSHNGIGNDSHEHFTDPDGFRDNTTAIELNDLQILIDHLLTTTNARYKQDSCTLIGHSRGGSVAILHAAKDKRVKKLATWNAVSDLHSWIAKYDADQWRSDGHVVIENARTGEELPMGYGYLKDLEKHSAERDVLGSASLITVPWVIIQAANDEAVPVAHASALHNANPSSQLIILQDTGHTYGGKHPWHEKNLPGPLTLAIEHSL